MRKRNKEKMAAWQRRYNKTPQRRKYILAYKEKNRDHINALARKRYTTDGRWEKQLWDRFKLLAEDYWKMYNAQNGLCVICGKPQCVGIKLDVDHDHTTGKVRALLCRHCNAGIGLLKDSSELVLKALEYLRIYETKSSPSKSRKNSAAVILLDGSKADTNHARLHAGRSASTLSSTRNEL